MSPRTHRDEATAYIALRRVERYPNVILTALPRTDREDATA
jgi:hypothetical protein